MQEHDRITSSHLSQQRVLLTASGRIIAAIEHRREVALKNGELRKEVAVCFQ